MSPEGTKRKLTAILSADVKGYSRLMEDDEEATVATLTSYREVMTKVIGKHSGRVVDSPGDNLLAEFASVVDAMRGAVEIQEELRVRNSELPDHRRMEFRIGINLGDVIEEEDRIYGDGVNIAARVEGLAEPGGICVSGTAYEHLKNKLSLGIEYLGDHDVKNISEPVPVYRLILQTGPAKPAPAAETRRSWPTRSWATWAAVLAVVIAAGSVGIWKITNRSASLPEEAESGPVPTTQGLDNPTIAVLPFANLSGDPALESFSDGLTEQVITTLSKDLELSVTARNSSFMYKGKSVKVEEVGRELGVQYVLEGSTQRSGGQIRITAQLIDTSTGHHVWSERYDRGLEDLFAVQDDVAMQIRWGMQRKLTAGEQARMYERGTEKLEAAEQCLEAFQYLSRCTKEGNALAQEGLEKALVTDPGYPGVHMWLAYSHLMDAWYGWSESSSESIKQAEERLNQARELAQSRGYNRQPEIQAIQGLIHVYKGQYDEALVEAERAVKLNPNAATAHALAAKIFSYAGKHEEGLAAARKAIELDPLPSSLFFVSLGDAQRVAGHPEEAIEAYQKALYRSPDLLDAKAGLAAAYSLTGQDEEARAVVREILRIDPKFSLTYFAKTLPFKNASDRDTAVEALRNAGTK
jgi:adenylate cyclase